MGTNSPQDLVYRVRDSGLYLGLGAAIFAVAGVVAAMLAADEAGDTSAKSLSIAEIFAIEAAVAAPYLIIAAILAAGTVVVRGIAFLGFVIIDLADDLDE